MSKYRIAKFIQALKRIALNDNISRFGVGVRFAASLISLASKKGPHCCGPQFFWRQETKSY
jgi:hypothetical protein